MYVLAKFQSFFSRLLLLRRQKVLSLGLGLSRGAYVAIFGSLVSDFTIQRP